jgi:glycerate-2-kinase
MRDYRADLKDIFMAAVDYADPEKLVREKVVSIGNSLFMDSNSIFSYRKLYMFALGKAASAMAKGLMSVVEIDKGVVVSNVVDNFPSNIKTVKAGHPYPDDGSIAGAQECMRLAAEADEETLSVFLVSGGGSAMVCSPAFGITLEEKIRTFDLLMKSGANIEEINIVRRHISNVKGGKLAEMAKPSTVVTLAMSDVLSNAGNAIASGPTYHDETTWGDVLYVTKKYRILEKLPATVQRVIHDGFEGNLPDTSKESWDRFNYFNIGSNISGMFKAADKAIALGYDTKIYGQQFTCGVKEAAEVIVTQAMEQRYIEECEEMKPVCLVFGGEVSIPSEDKPENGRCMRLAIEYLLKTRVYASFGLFASTDGMDGDTDAAGAYVSGDEDLEKAAEYLEKNDLYGLFEKYKGLFKTGLTGTNINDIYLIIIPVDELACLLSLKEAASAYIGSDAWGRNQDREYGTGGTQESCLPEQKRCGNQDKNRNDG